MGCLCSGGEGDMKWAVGKDKGAVGSWFKVTGWR